MLTIRRATVRDLPFLWEMLYEAAYWDRAAPRPTCEEFAADPQLNKLLADWGRAGDTAFVAESAGAPLGAAWYRFWTADDHSFGYVAPDTPEIGIAVAAGHRSRGIGRALLRALIQEARSCGVRALSLSVASANFARRLYASEGFLRVGGPEDHWTCLLTLTGDAPRLAEELCANRPGPPATAGQPGC